MVTEVRVCERCGVKFIGHHNKQYCDDCRPIVRKETMKESYERRKLREQLGLKPYKERVAHQQDKTVWTKDYAERQKQKTLEMLGRIEV